jgi:hypothetical protein
LIPVRLAVVSASPAMKLRDLTPGDVRLILTRRPYLRDSIVNAHRHGSADG